MRNEGILSRLLDRVNPALVFLPLGITLVSPKMYRDPDAVEGDSALARRGISDRCGNTKRDDTGAINVKT